jgi:hypothetical protein
MFSMPNRFSRCFVIANNPILLVLTGAIGVCGVIMTAVGVAMWGVCEEPHRFSGAYLSAKVSLKEPHLN